jgi:hypothetical protein
MSYIKAKVEWISKRAKRQSRLHKEFDEAMKFYRYRSAVSIIVNQRYYYSIGGEGDSEVQPSCKRIDLITGELVNLADIIHPVMEAAIFALDGKIYIFGTSISFTD